VSATPMTLYSFNVDLNAWDQALRPLSRGKAA
jgi:hypothetical protein